MSPPTPDMLGLLYEQHRIYTVELGRTHQKLSKLYKKLSKAERVLAEREQRHLSRDERKKWQYSRIHTKRNVSDLECEQAKLHDALRQCNDLIASLEHGPYSSPMTPWTAQLPPSPFLFSPFSPITAMACSPFAYGSHGASMTSQPMSQTQYWDLTSLPEVSRRRQSRQLSPYGTRSAGSGFGEAPVVGNGKETRSRDGSHAYAHELTISPLNLRFNGQAPETSATAESGELDIVPDLKKSAPPVELGAASGESSQYSHKRCVSADAVALDLAKLAPPLTKRGNSVGPASVRSQS